MRSAHLLVLIGMLGQAVPAQAAVGRLKILTYNIAGLPDGFSTEHPSANVAAIGMIA